jgi:hypothetical protein
MTPWCLYQRQLDLRLPAIIFSSPEEVVGAVRHAMDLYEKHFAPTR